MVVGCSSSFLQDACKTLHVSGLSAFLFERAVGFALYPGAWSDNIIEHYFDGICWAVTFRNI